MCKNLQTFHLHFMRLLPLLFRVPYVLTTCKSHLAVKNMQQYQKITAVPGRSRSDPAPEKKPNKTKKRPAKKSREFYPQDAG